MTDTFDRLKAALADRYAIEHELGSGGMATVYLAEDLKHKRKVAVKVLRPELANTVGPDRFIREIEVAARLTHPHILPLHDSGEADAFLYYVMPFVQGESLRDRMTREGTLPITDVVKILREIVDALSSAHAEGVVHRDIKPDNVMLSQGHALVMDFGVAKAVSEATGGHQVTTAGVALGTPSYMAPEQAVADPNVDHRADLYAAGTVAYEMLAGRAPFDRPTPQAVLAAHVTDTPEPIATVREETPPALARLVMRCLEKSPTDRWQTADEMAHELDRLTTPSSGMAPTEPHGGTRVAGRRRIVYSAVGLAALLGVLAVTRIGSDSFEVTSGSMSEITLAAGLELDPTISPDGQSIAYVAGPPGHMRLYVRPVSGDAAVPLAETVGGNQRQPRWSPDGTRLLFQLGTQDVYVVSAQGGDARKLFDVPGTLYQDGVSATWSPDGNGVAYVDRGSLMVRSADGGDVRELAESFRPHSLAWSPDGSRIAFVSGNPTFVYGRTDIANIAPSALWIVSADGGESVQVTGNEHMNLSPAWAAGGTRLFFVSDRGGGRDIYHVGIDESGTPTDESVRLTTGVQAHSVSISGDGTRMAYSVFTHRGNIWAIDIPDDPPGIAVQATQITSGSQVTEGIGVSPDGEWLVFDSDRSGNQDIWRLQLSGGEPEQLTTHASADFIPSWSADGLEIVFYSFRTGNRDLFTMRADGTMLQQVYEAPAQERYPDWSPDGDALVFHSDKTGRRELFVVERAARDAPWGEPTQLTFDGGFYPRWSPTGEHVAYIVELGAGAALRTVTPDGGELIELVRGQDAILGPIPTFADWAPDGQTIYYKTLDAQGVSSFWSVPVTGGTPQLLVTFDDPSKPSIRYEFATDGRRFFFTFTNHESDIWAMELVTR